MTAPELTDGVVRLRALEEQDFAAYRQAFADDPGLANLLGFEEAPDPAALPRENVEWAIADAASNSFLGTVTLHSVDERHRRGETRFWVARDARGRGVLTRALALVLAWAFDVARLERMELTALPENTVVPRIAEKFGYVLEGTLRKRNFERGRRVDLCIWGLLRDERSV